jgi:hypothetical protein
MTPNCSRTRGTLFFLLGLTAGSLLGRPVTNEKPFFETSLVTKSDGGAFTFDAIPGVAATPGGKLIAVWISYPPDPKPRLHLVGAVSADGSRTWPAPLFLRIDSPRNAN